MMSKVQEEQEIKELLFNPETILSKDLKEAAKNLSDTEARFLVDTYYIIQRQRITANNQIRALNESQEPHMLVNWIASNNEKLEAQIQRALGVFAESKQIGLWSLSQVGIGPVISAGLIAHIDMKQATYASNILRYAGLDPKSLWLGKEKAKALVESTMEEMDKKEVDNELLVTLAARSNRKVERIIASLKDKWTKAEIISVLSKRPWNAKLKLLQWKTGMSFTKTCNNKNAFYGLLYLKRKQLEEERNEAGLYAEQAKKSLAEKKWNKDTDAYKAYIQGKLPPARILLRAQRYAVSIFLNHWFEVAYFALNNKLSPKPWILVYGKHQDYIKIPNAHVVPGLQKALDRDER